MISPPTRHAAFLTALVSDSDSVGGAQRRRYTLCYCFCCCYTPLMALDSRLLRLISSTADRYEKNTTHHPLCRQRQQPKSTSRPFLIPFRRCPTHNATYVLQNTLPPAPPTKIEPWRGVHAQHLRRRGIVKIQKVKITQIHLEEAHVVLRGIDDYDAAKIISTDFKQKEWGWRRRLRLRSII